MIRTFILFFFLMVAEYAALSQTSVELQEGVVSYVTSTNVYVKFNETGNLAVGDTLFVSRNEEMIPALVINNKSSISCVCTPLSGIAFKEKDIVISKKAIVVETDEIPDQSQDTFEETVIAAPAVADTAANEKITRTQEITGRLSLSSYTNWSNATQDVRQRMRYTFSFYGDNLGGSKLSFESYISFVHQLDQWPEVQDNFFNALKIYNFSLKYDITPTNRVWLGRRINYNLSSLGAIDGLQYEHAFRHFTLGLVVGSKPDYRDYSIDFSLFTYGAYLTNIFHKGSGKMETTLAYLNQTNNGKTDRRFLYFQHTNMLLKKLFFIGTVEFDLYSVVDNQSKTSFNLTNLYFLLRYSILKNLNISASYSARQNIVLYETYKDYLERMLESGTLQGFRFMINYRPAKYLSLGVKAGYRYRLEDPNPTNDVYGFLSYSNVPGIDASATASVTWLKTSYLKGWVYSVGLSRDFVKGKIFAGINYRYVSYDFTISDLPLVQNIGEINVNWRIYNKLSMGVFYEGTFETVTRFNRIYINLTQRF